MVIVKLISTFIDCIKLPNKTAMKRLNRLEMRNTILFLLTLLFILALPIEINLLLDDSFKESDIPQNIYIIQVLIFYPFFMLFLGLAGITLLAGVGVVISKMVHRNIKFQLLWKLSAFALTKPILLFALFDQVFALNWIVNVLIVGYLFWIIIRIILHYPRRQVKA
ncbi:DUF1189 family protein [Fredinandcohnia sp. 179-A 10B2 NHS]